MHQLLYMNSEKMFRFFIISDKTQQKNNVVNKFMKKKHFQLNLKIHTWFNLISKNYGFKMKNSSIRTLVQSDKSFRQNFKLQSDIIFIYLSIQQLKALKMNKQNIKSTQIYKFSKSYIENEPDLYLVLRDKIYPSHRRFLNHSNYISKKIASKDKVVLIEFEFQSQKFEKVLNFIYTSSLSFDRNTEELQNIFDIAELLQMDNLKQQILEHVDDHFEQYNIFCLYKIANKYNVKWLKQRCEEEFTTLEYEHFNINRYDLLQTSQKLFQKMIKDHQRLKANKTISGLKVQQIKYIIQEYNQHNKCNLNVEQLIRASHDCFQIHTTQPKSIFNRKKTLSPPRKKQQTLKNKRISKSNSADEGIHHSTISSQKSKEIQDQDHEKNEIQNQGQGQIHMIKQIRDEIFQIDQVQSPIVEFFDLEDKINQFSKISQCQDDQFLQNNDSYGQISERSCQQDDLEGSSINEDEQNIKENQNCLCQKKTLSSPTQQIQYNCLPKIPVIYKNFMF